MKFSVFNAIPYGQVRERVNAWPAPNEFYEPEQGEMRTATFERVMVNSELADDAFARSSMVTLMLRSPAGSRTRTGGGLI